VNVRQLAAGDEHILALLNDEDAAFDLPGRGGPRPHLSAGAAAEYLADPSVLHWIAEYENSVVGHLLCYVQRRRRGEACQVMVYEIGVRNTHRGRNVGRTLMTAMQRWMREHGVREAWVLADNPGAEAFYTACGFRQGEDQPVEMSYQLD
jgi:GNAT superfamily N-acetyltransferase